MHVSRIGADKSGCWWRHWRRDRKRGYRRRSGEDNIKVDNIDISWEESYWICMA